MNERTSSCAEMPEEDGEDLESLCASAAVLQQPAMVIYEPGVCDGAALQRQEKLEESFGDSATCLSFSLLQCWLDKNMFLSKERVTEHLIQCYVLS